MTSTLQAVVFDFNGTLSDDEPVLARVYQELFAELGRPITNGIIMCGKTTTSRSGTIGRVS